MNFDCVILAAGLSSRMGRWKPEIKINGKKLIVKTVENAAVNCRNIIVVGGYRFTELSAILSSFDNVSVVENHNYEKGMITSLKRALKEIGTDRFFLTLGDMPYISSDVFLKMSRSVNCDVLFPVKDGRRGHPVLIRKSLADRILRAPDDIPIRDILAEYKASEIEIDDSGIFRDIDRPEDLP